MLLEGQVMEVPVQIGLSGDNGTEILDDTLREGDTLVLNSSSGTTSGTRAGGMGMGGMFVGGRP